MNKTKTVIQYLIFLLIIPVVILLGATVFKERQYAFTALAVAVLACVPFFIFFEKSESGGRLLIVIAVMIAMASVGRFIFTALPHFKPVTAIVVITAIYFGPRAGFVTGALTAVVSNFYLGQGPWTPFQMFAWGIIGLFAGILAPFIRDRKPLSVILLLIYGVFSGILYSLLMDAWVTLWWDGTFNLTRFSANAITALPVTATYAVSNVVFLLVFTFPLGTVLERLKYKYGIGS